MLHSKLRTWIVRGIAWLDVLTQSPRGIGLVVLIFTLAVVTGLGSVEIWGIREKRVAACVADTLYDGHWLLPQLCDEPRLEKPPLPYWVIVLFSRLVGR